MSTDKIKELMRAGDLDKASEELSRRLAAEPDNVELKLLYGTCRRLLGDLDTFVKIDDEVSKTPEAEGNAKWRRYHEFRVAACGAALLIAANLAPAEDRVLYGIAPMYGISPDYCKSYSAHVAFDAGGGSGRMGAKTVTLNECKYNSYVVPSSAFSRPGYQFVGWMASSTCAHGSDEPIAPGTEIDLLDYLHVDCRGTLTLTAKWRWTGQSSPDAGFSTYAQAHTFVSALYSESRPVGIVTVKTGKINKRTGYVKLSGFVQKADGKKLAFRAASANGASGQIAASLSVASADSASISISDGRLSGSWDGYRIDSANIGGEIYKSAEFDFGDMPEEINGYSVNYPCENEPVSMNGIRWACAKNASMKWKKCPPCRSGVCADCGYGSWIVNDSNGKTNVSGLKLSYNAKQGTFKGSFKVFTWSPNGAKYTVSVSGIVVDGVGYGTATLKKFGLSWPVTVE